ncbi:MAG TPA: HAD family hydrolase [Acidobacteriaceae bacterium]|nr:HAD family hydrolase [Acidobacteriaceae bacterium]
MASAHTQSAVFQRSGFRWDEHDAYLFDIDGTLLRCRDRIHVDAFYSSVHAVLGRELDLNGVVLSGNTDPGILRDAFRASSLDDQHWQPHFENILQRIRDDVAARHAEFRIDMMPGVEETLRYLHSKGATLGIATGNLESVGWLKIEFLGLRSWFTFGGFSDRCLARSEMIAQAALQARSLAGAHASVCIVGDTPADIAAARANNLPVVAVATGNYTFEQLMQHEPDACATTMLALLEGAQSPS